MYRYTHTTQIGTQVYANISIYQQVYVHTREYESMNTQTNIRIFKRMHLRVYTARARTHTHTHTHTHTSTLSW